MAHFRDRFGMRLCLEPDPDRTDWLAQGWIFMRSVDLPGGETGGAVGPPGEV